MKTIDNSVYFVKYMCNCIILFSHGRNILTSFNSCKKFIYDIIVSVCLNLLFCHKKIFEIFHVNLPRQNLFPTAIFDCGKLLWQNLFAAAKNCRASICLISRAVYVILY